MRRLYAGFCALLLALAVFVPVQTGECYVTLKYKQMPFEFGKIRLPEDMYVVEIDFNSFIDKMEKDQAFKREIDKLKDYDQTRLTRWAIEAMQTKEVKEHLKTMSLYQAGLYDGECRRTVWFLVIHDNKYFTDRYGDFFKGKMTDEKKEKVIAVNRELKKLVEEYTLKDGEKFDYPEVKTVKLNETLSSARFELGEVSDVEFVRINGKPAYAASVRLAGEMLHSFGSLYFKEYDFQSKGKMTSLIFMSYDSDREFWTKIFDNSLIQKDKR